jgi:hypothetical protein
LDTDLEESLQDRPIEGPYKFRNWYEPWEMMLFKKEGNQYFKQIVELKYGALQFKRQDDGSEGFTLKEGCAVLVRTSANKKYGTELQAVDGCCWFYGVLVCYDGFDVDLPYDDQDNSLYDIMELMNSDFYDGVRDYYAENPDPRLQIMKRGDMPSWKLPKDKNYALKGGVYVGGEYESASDSGEEEEFDDDEE